MNLLIIFLIAISLSMDAFSLSLTVGTTGIKKNEILFLSIIVGIFHFIMPLVGTNLGTTFIDYFHVNTNFLTGIIFMYISIQMFKEYKSNDVMDFKFGFLNCLIFAFSVSLDSFGIGFTYDKNDYNVLSYFFIFSIFSFSFTYLGLILGKKLKVKYGNIATILGTVILFIIATYNFVKFCFYN